MKCLHWNGHASLRPCFILSNVFKKGSNMEGLNGYQDICCSDPNLLRRWESEQWHRNIDSVLDARRRRSRGEINKTELGEIIKQAGFKPDLWYDEERDEITLAASKLMLPDYQALIDAQVELGELALPLGGTLDGWGTVGNAGD